MKAALNLLFVTILSLGFSQHSSNHSEHNQHTNSNSSFAEREQEVMPFSLEATLHTFQDTPSGGIQQVTTKDASDQNNIKLIREHLKKEAELFAQGIFSDPSYLHGEDMPGLQKIKQAGEEGHLEVTYQDIPSGGQISYRSTDLTVVIALHLWFQAQVIDHGDHAAVGN